jgi:hypothetical protein
MIRLAALVSLSLMLAGASCRSGKQAPEPGAVLLQLRLEPGAPAPDELRLWVYDNDGTIWNDVRFPSEGALAPPHGDDLGTILIQPGGVSGNLRIHARALAGGVRVLDGTLATTASATAELELDVALPADGDRDGVPDDIDDCAAAPNPAQGGCAIGDDGGIDDGGGGSEDAAGGTDGGDAGADDAGATDGGACDGVCARSAGAACGSATECASGFCTDGVCCPESCTDPCFSCGTGTCTAVRNHTDAPQCVSPMTCNAKAKCVGGG